mmetsp:Transcript_54267/g.156002  ORF Transcript_54267/g.156002 Transcript_54267/m.156002 type:complete len:329 (+) Transcript_54267:223-1209(+)
MPTMFPDASVNGDLPSEASSVNGEVGWIRGSDESLRLTAARSAASRPATSHCKPALGAQPRQLSLLPLMLAVAASLAASMSVTSPVVLLCSVFVLSWAAIFAAAATAATFNGVAPTCSTDRWCCMRVASAMLAAAATATAFNSVAPTCGTDRSCAGVAPRIRGAAAKATSFSGVSPACGTDRGCIGAISMSLRGGGPDEEGGDAFAGRSPSDGESLFHTIGPFIISGACIGNDAEVPTAAETLLVLPRAPESHVPRTTPSISSSSSSPILAATSSASCSILCSTDANRLVVKLNGGCSMESGSGDTATGGRSGVPKISANLGNGNARC